MLNFTAPKEITLRDYQADAIDDLREAMRGGKRKVILCAGTGAGKTVCAAHLLRQADAKGSYALFLVDRVALVNQTSATLDSYGINHGVLQGMHERYAPHENVQVCSIQTLARRVLPRDPDLIVYDECHCFVEGTLIATPDGPRRIEDIRQGDRVFNATGIGSVLHTFYNSALELVKVRFDDGSEIVCTPEHRFFTGDAWVQARFLDGQSAFGIEDMPSMWRNLSSKHPENGKRQLAGGARAKVAKETLLLEELCQEMGEPYASGFCSSEGIKNASVHKTQAEKTRRERDGINRAAASSAASAWERLESRICGEDWCAPRKWNSQPLEDRHSESEFDDCYRGGRREPLQPESAREGQAKGCISGIKRVVSVESFECPSARNVYNIEVSGHPSYFAEGALVHNCQYKSTLDYIAKNPQAVVVGLTATPFTKGMGAHWDGVVNVIPTRALIDGGHLIQPNIYVARSPEDAELGLNSYGEFSDESATSAGIQIIGDVVSEWVGKTQEHFGGPVKTIVFSPTVEHGRELCAAFGAAGYNFQQVSYLDRSDEERAAKIEEFRKPDSAIHGLVSCGVLTKGFDVPDVRVGISCKPYRKSLSSHMQEIGRVMRTHPDKDKALWLCHSGNVERFALDMFDVWQNGAGELDQAEKHDSKPRERNESTREAVVCQECGGAMHGFTCSVCGWEKPPRSGIHAVDGDLHEFSFEKVMEPRDGLRADILSDPRKVWEAALAYTLPRARAGEDKARRWAYGIWRGCYPNSKLPSGWFHIPMPAMTDPSADSLIDREVKRFRKRRAA